MRIAIITENFLPKLDGVTRTLARLLEHLQHTDHQALLLGPEAGMERYAGAEIIGTKGIPLFFYPELKFNFFRPLFFCLPSFCLHHFRKAFDAMERRSP